MASALDLIKTIGVAPLAAIQNKTPLLFVKQVLGLAPDPVADALAAGSGLERIGQAVAPIFASFIPGGSTAFSLSTSLTKSPVTVPTEQSLVQNIRTIAPLISPATPAYTGGRIMSFADGDSSGFSLPSLGDITGIFQGGLGQTALNLGSQALSGFISQSFAPQPVSYPIGQPVMAAVPMIGRAMAGVGRAFFNRFPNLATAIQGYINRGIPMTRTKLYGLLRRFGPDFLVSGGILSAAAIAELTIAGPGRRRMNPGNVKALRRCHRRMKAFHRIVQHNDYYLGGHRRKKSIATGKGALQITQVK